MVNIATLQPESVMVVRDRSAFGPHAVSVEHNCERVGFKGTVSIVDQNDLASMVAESHDVPDVAVVLVDALTAIDAVDRLCRAGVSVICVVTGGYPSTRLTAETLRDTMCALAETYDVTLLGPDGGSYVNMTTSVAPFTGSLTANLRNGSVAIVSQGMAVVEAVTMSNRIALSTAISCGTSAAYAVTDALDDLAEDPNTTAVLAFIEGVRNGSDFLRAVSNLTRKGKLLGVCKIGRSAVSNAGVMAHSNSVAGNADAFDAAARAAGAIICDDLDELIALGETVTTGSVPRGPRIHVVAYSGAEANMIADIAHEAGLKLPPISREGRARLRRQWPELTVSNPLDPWFIDRHEVAYAEAFDVCTAEDGDIVVLALDQSYEAPESTVALAADLIRLLADHVKPSGKSAVVLSPVHHCPPSPIKRLCGDLGIPLILGAQPGLSALAKVALRRESRVDQRFLAEHELASRGGPARAMWDEDRSQALLEQYGIDVPRRARVESVAEACRAADSISYPVVVKGVSSEIAHKQHAGLVFLDLRSRDEVQNCAAAILDRGRFSIMVAEHVRGDVEVFLGMNRDPVFGPVALLGMGGRWVEAVGAVVTGLLPMSEDDAERFIDDSVIASVVRTLPYAAACRVRIAAAICGLSRLSITESHIVAVDMNPLVVGRHRVVAVDALVTGGGN